MRSLPSPAALLIASVLVATGACAPAASPDALDERTDVTSLEQEAGVTCVGAEPCSGTGEVYRSGYRVGTGPTARAELAQTFTATRSNTPGFVRLVLRNLRRVTSDTPPQVRVALRGPVAGSLSDAAQLTPLVEGSLPLGEIAPSGATTIGLSGAGTLVAGQTYALFVSVDGVDGAAAATDSTLVGVGALVESTFGGEASSRIARRASAQVSFAASRFRVSGPWDVAFALGGGEGAPCASSVECASGLECASNACAVPAPPVVTDPHFANVVLLAHADGVNGGTAFPEVLGAAATVGNATTTTARAAFGTASMNLGAGGAYVSFARRPQYDLGAGDFTLEVWVHPITLNPVFSTILTLSQSSSSAGAAVGIGITSDGKVNGAVSAGSTYQVILSGTSALPMNTWSHLAFTRQGNTFRVYLNGALEGTTSWAGSVYFDPSRGQFFLGGYDQTYGSDNYRYSMVGAIDEARVTRGVARYTGSTYAVPSEAFPDAGPNPL